MKRRSWLRLVFVAAALLLTASWGISGALEAGWARRPLMARLAASFGRPVEVGHFTFSLLSGPRLEADSVVVAEDPRFGQEYFLRADQLTASLRWTALLRGRIEFGALSLTRPSLNVVRTSDGSWNIESWLPPAKAAATTSGTNAMPGASSGPIGPLDGAARAKTETPPRFANIEVDGGRINFKRGVEKLQFALVDVSGSLDQDSAGRWSLDLEAHPMRASVALQEAGTLRLQGTVAGTSARLRPAALNLTWEDASLADAVRLARGSDYGVRGTLGAEFSAKIDDPPVAGDAERANDEWTIEGIVRLAGIHAWDLAGESTNPAVNVSVTAGWRSGVPRVEVRRCVLESPNSRLDATGEIDWSRGFKPSVQLVSSHVSLAELLAWRRAFSTGIAEDLAVDGSIDMSAKLADWPPRVEQANLTSTGAILRASVLPGPIRIGPIQATLSRGSFAIAPVSVSLPDLAARVGARNTNEATDAPGGILRVQGALGPFRVGDVPRDWPYRLAISGQTGRAQDLVAMASVFGKPANPDWTVAGPAGFNLSWTGSLRGTSTANGTLDLPGLQLTSVVMNQPLVVSSAHIELRPGERHVKLAEAQAFGARWNGTLDWRAADGAWSFDLSADRLDASELDRWLGPRARPSLLDRMLPFAGPADPMASREAALARLKAHGRLRVGQVEFAPLRVEKLDAAVEIAGRSVALRGAQVDFYGGRVFGDFEARLNAADPTYVFRGQIERANLAALTSATTSLAGRFSGIGTGRLVLSAHGVGRPALLASLEGEGALEVRDPVLRGIDLSAWTAGNADTPEDSSDSRFDAGSAAFHIEGGWVRVDRLLLAARNEQFAVAGSVGFARQLDLRLRAMPRGSDPGSDADLKGDAWVVAGTLDEPQVTRSSVRQSTRQGIGAGVPAARR